MTWLADSSHSRLQSTRHHGGLAKQTFSLGDEARRDAGRTDLLRPAHREPQAREEEFAVFEVA
jgi:hypothetical protein